MNEAFFFGPSERQLFGTYHPPRNGEGRVLTVICPPLFVEYTRTWLALRKLAMSLSERGQHVLRFDYRGTGDSFGDIADVAVADWKEDIALAVHEGCELSGSTVVRMIGVRAGAMLACDAVGAEERVQRLVLWDPIADGAGYIESLRRLQQAALEDDLYLSRAEQIELANEYQGFLLSGRMLEEFDRLGSETYAAVPNGKLHVVSSTSNHETAVDETMRSTVAFDCKWESSSEDALTPSIVLERLVTCLTAA